MKLPHITIEYREEETYALGKVSIALIFGFGLHWAWVYLFMFNGAELFFPRAPDMQGVFFISSLVVFVATLLSYGIFLKPLRRLFSTPQKRGRNRMFAAFSVFVAMVLMSVADAVPAAQFVCGFAAGILSGAGSAVLLMSYGVSFSVCDLATAAFCTAASLPVSSIVFVLIVILDTAMRPFGAIACLCIPFLELLCLRKCSSNLVDNLEFTSITIPVRTAPFALHVCLPSLVFGFIAGVIRQRATSVSMEGAEASTTLLAIALAGIFAFAVVVVAMLTQRQSNNFAFRTLVPLIAALLALQVIPEVSSSAWMPFAFFGSYLMLEACLWIMYSDISQQFRISAFTVFGFGRGSLALGALMSFLLTQPGAPLQAVATDIDMLVVAAFVAFSFGVSLLPNNRELRQTLKRGKSCPALVSDADYALDPADALTHEADRTQETKPEPNRIAPENRSRQNAFADETARSAADAVEPSGFCSMPSGHADDDDAQRAAGRFKRKCSSVADRYLLSRKETEVLYLLAKGRNSAVIQESLYISAGTANTHMRHIYRKLDVHSQRELMDLVESEVLED